MRDITLTSAAREAFVRAHSPECQPDRTGNYQTSVGPTYSPVIAWSIYSHYGPAAAKAKPRNALVRRLVAARWPDVMFKVRSGVAKKVHVSWTDGPTVQQVRDELWACEDLTPAQAFHSEFARATTVQGACLAFLRSGTRAFWSVDLSGADEDELQLATSLARMCGMEPGAVMANNNTDLLNEICSYGPAIAATAL